MEHDLDKPCKMKLLYFGDAQVYLDHYVELFGCKVGSPGQLPWYHYTL